MAASAASPPDSAAPWVPPRPTLSKLKSAAAGCRGCDLWERGTQTVFGEGGRRATLLLVGEQPGDREDVEGRPFVGPAGRLLDEALEEAGIDRADAYVTNVVKYFKWEPRGKKRIHQKPNAVEIAACRPWLDAELAVVAPRVLVCLGATAAQALLGKSFRVTKSRGEPVASPLAPHVLTTVYPSSILRSRQGGPAPRARPLREGPEGRRSLSARFEGRRLIIRRIVRCPLAREARELLTFPRRFFWDARSRSRQLWRRSAGAKPSTTCGARFFSTGAPGWPIASASALAGG